MNTPSFSRRRFLQTTGSAMLASTIGRAAPTSANGKLQHACIGVGGMMGGRDLGSFLSHPDLEIVAICDVDAGHLEAARQRVPNARTYNDWRELIAKEGDRIDSLNATVPDHMHASIALTALHAGKHVYCQKPLCHEVAEVRALVEAAKRSGRVTQLGTQYASGIGDRMAVHYLRSGAIGKIKRVYLAANRSGANQYRLEGPRPAGQEPPAGLNWDLWLGSASSRPFAPEIYHPVMWRSWRDFGTGWSGDIGCHLFSAVYKALDLTAPKRLSAKVQETWKNSRERRMDTWPQSNHITWSFPGTAMTEGDELIIEWFDGEFYPPEEIRSIHRGNYPGESAMFIGTEGSMLLPHTSGPILYPSEKFKSLERPKLEPRNHYHHFVDACLGKDKTESDFIATGPLSETVLLGTVAIRLPEIELQWDAAAMKFPNHPAADSLLRRNYRNGWGIESLG
jgi:predicted dehydrogenase